MLVKKYIIFVCQNEKIRMSHNFLDIESSEFGRLLKEYKENIYTLNLGSIKDDRYHNISNLYNTILGRDYDLNGLISYYTSDLSISDIKCAMLNSEEYLNGSQEIANFFWEGEMTNLEKKCIKSFADAGFLVKLWSYNNIALPYVESCDANHILPQNINIKQELNSKTESAAYLAAFSDYFRYKVVSINGGWWFDTDCYCLKGVNYYKKLKIGRRAISCKQNNDYHDSHHIGCGAFWMDRETSKKLIDSFEKNLENTKGKLVHFGYFGPEFFTHFIKSNGLYDDMLPVEYFYSIHWDEVDLMIYPENNITAHERTKNSLLTHIWTTHFNQKGIDKNNPIKDSFLDDLYNKKKIDVIVVSSNYNDFLKITLPNNLKYLNKEDITIVTSSSDIECQQLCTSLGVRFIVTDRMYEKETKIFNRSKAINDGIASLINPDFILLLDGDIILKEGINLNDLDRDRLYSVEKRKIYLTYNDYVNGKNGVDESNNYYGYFQLFNIINKDIDQSSPLNEHFNKGMGKEDEWFRDRFSKKGIINLEIEHLGMVGENWAGRKSEIFK